MSSLLVVEDLVKHYLPRGFQARHPPVRAVDGVSLKVGRGETLGLVGESGCGKSTLGRAILRLVEPTSGRVRLGDEDVTALGRSSLRRFRRRAQMIFQDPYGSLNPRMTVGEILSEPLIIHALPDGGGAKEREAEVLRLLDRVHLRAELLCRRAHELSGGQRQRIGIARALSVRPELIVADEPLSALDVSIQAQVVNLLVELQAAEQLTYLFISHDLRVVGHLCDRVAVMYLGRIVEEAETSALVARRRHPYTEALYSAVPALSPMSAGTPRRRLLLDGEVPSPSSPPTGCAFHPRCPLYAEKGKPERCRTEAPKLEGHGEAEHGVACHFGSER